MSKRAINPHSCAFPAGEEDVSGLTKREVFAIIALLGLLAAGHSRPADDAVAHADMLIKVLSNTDFPT